MLKAEWQAGRTGGLMWGDRIVNVSDREREKRGESEEVSPRGTKGTAVA